MDSEQIAKLLTHREALVTIALDHAVDCTCGVCLAARTMRPDVDDDDE